MKKLFNRIAANSSLELAAKMYLIFLIIFYVWISHHYIFPIVAFALLYAITNKKFLQSPVFWLIISICFIPGLYADYYKTGNHSFVAFYIALLFLIACSYKKHHKQILYLNAKVLLAIIMSFAVIQKVLSDTFMDGSSLSYLNSRGGFFTHLQRFFKENQNLIYQNKNLIEDQASSVEKLNQSIELTSINWIFEYNPSLAVVAVLLVEVFFVLFLFVKNQYVRNSYLIIFISTLILTRVETGFASLLCVLLFLQAQKDHSAFKAIYICIFCIYISLILTRLGYH